LSPKKALRRFIPIPRQKTLRKWFPSFDSRNIAHLIDKCGTDLVVDVGANEGQFVYRLRSAGCGLPIVSFEPLSSCHSNLVNQAVSDAAWTIAPRQALGAASGETTLFELQDTSLSSVLNPHSETRTISGFDVVKQEQVPINRLDDALNELGLNSQKPFLKIDVQGTEKDVMEGAPITLDKAVGLQIELGFTALYDGEESYLEMLKRLDLLGFYPVFFADVVHKKRLGARDQVDAIFFRQSG